MYQQLPLAVSLRDDTTFDNFWVTESNAAIVHGLQQFLTSDENSLFLWGAAGSGVTHLLQAVQHAAAKHSALLYLPLAELVDFDAEALFENLEQLDLLCIDNLEAVVGRSEWESALFHLFNRLRDNGSKLIIGAQASPRELAISLADLQSRLTWGAVYHAPLLDDEQKCEALQMRASRLGLQLQDEVAKYLLHRMPRDMHQLFDMLEQLDHQSLAKQRKLTIPFVKQALNS